MSILVIIGICFLSLFALYLLIAFGFKAIWFIFDLFFSILRGICSAIFMGGSSDDDSGFGGGDSGGGGSDDSW